MIMSLHLRNPRANSQSGFTLVEIMVVLFIIGIMAGIVVMSVPPRTDPVVATGEKLAGRLRMVAQTSMVEHQAYGVVLGKTEYNIVKFEGQVWQGVQHFDYELDAQPELVLVKNGAKLNLEVAEKTGIPVIRYDTTGLATPFTLSITSQTGIVRLIGRVDGSVLVEHGNERGARG